MADFGAIMFIHCWQHILIICNILIGLPGPAVGNSGISKLLDTIISLPPLLMKSFNSPTWKVNEMLLKNKQNGKKIRTDGLH